MIHSISVPLPAEQRRLRLPCAARYALLTASLLATLAAHAQPAANPARLDPLDPKASVPALSYESSFSQYRRLVDEKPGSWRDANDTVTRIGGWRFYAREAQQSDPAPAAPTAPPNGLAKPMPAGYDSHKRP